MVGNDNEQSQSLQNIIFTRYNGRKRGGVQKSGKNNRKGNGYAKPSAPVASICDETKIIISSLPKDVDEIQLKDYFATIFKAGHPKRILLQYGANGRSLGSATVIFNRSKQAIRAVKALENIKIDGRLVRVELLVRAASVPTPAPKPGLVKRVSQPKDKPKSATGTKTPGAGRRSRERPGVRFQNTHSKKTVEELDQEMTDYFHRNDDNVDTAAVPNGSDDDTKDEAL